MNLHEEMAAVVENLKAREWIQHRMKKGEKVCAHGAVMTCQGLRPGDAQIIRAVMRAKGVTEEWNDEVGRTKDEVVERMARIEVSDADLADTFGPSWRLVVAVIRQAAVLTPENAQHLAAARDAARDATRDAARAAARDAARDAAWSAAWSATRAAAWAAARDTAWSAAARDAIWAAVVADLIGQHGFTQQHYDTLMGPWIAVFGTNWAA